MKWDSADEQHYHHTKQYNFLIARFTQFPGTGCKDGVVNKGDGEDSTPLSPQETQPTACKN